MTLTIHALFEAYKETREWKRLAPNSQKTYQQMMDYGEKDAFLVSNRVSLITDTFVDGLYEKLKVEKSLSFATMFMKVMRRIWSVMLRKNRKEIKYNPFREMGLTIPAARTQRWLPEQVAVYTRHLWDNKEYQLFILARLCYELGQRPGDMSMLSRKNFNADFSEVKFVQQKTKKSMHLPVLEDTRRFLKAFGQFDKLVTLDPRDISILHHKTLRTLGLPDDLQLRDLRRSALMEVMEHGGSDAEGQAISGHVNRQELNTYSPSTLQMAVNAQNKRFGKFQ